MEIKLNDVFRHEFSFNQKDVEKFAQATGDFNPIHLDNDYAKNTIFKRTIIHGFLGGSIFSKVFGTLFPGEGTIYLKQNLIFLQPMFVNEIYNSVFTVLEIDPAKNRALVKTEIINQDKKVIITGEALIQNSIIK